MAAGNQGDAPLPQHDVSLPQLLRSLYLHGVALSLAPQQDAKDQYAENGRTISDPSRFFQMSQRAIVDAELLLQEAAVRADQLKLYKGLFCIRNHMEV